MFIRASYTVGLSTDWLASFLYRSGDNYSKLLGNSFFSLITALDRSYKLPDLLADYDSLWWFSLGLLTVRYLDLSKEFITESSCDWGELASTSMSTKWVWEEPLSSLTSVIRARADVCYFLIDKGILEGYSLSPFSYAATTSWKSCIYSTLDTCFSLTGVAFFLAEETG